jgi:hypothetical protein
MKTYGDDPRIVQAFNLIHAVAVERRSEHGPAGATDDLLKWRIERDSGVYVLAIECICIIEGEKPL